REKNGSTPLKKSSSKSGDTRAGSLVPPLIASEVLPPPLEKKTQPLPASRERSDAKLARRGSSQRVAKGTASAPARGFSFAGRRQSLPLADREVDGVFGYKYGPCSTLTGARARPRDHEVLPGKTAGRAKKKRFEWRALGAPLPAEDNEDGAEDKADQKGCWARALFRAAARRQHSTVPAGAASKQKGLGREGPRRVPPPPPDVVGSADTAPPGEGAGPKPARRTPHTLEDLCYRAVIKVATLRRLKGSDLPTLPPLIRRRLTTLSTQDFLEIESAPFKDMFDFHMYHRALTYRVRCTLDGGEYMAAHAGTCNSVQLSNEDFWQWVELAHPNLMCVYALALDADTSNVFLIMEMPDATLKRLEIFLVSQGLCFPEYFLWKVAEQLSSVIMYVEERQLSFGRFDLKNVYLGVQSIFLGDKVNIGGHYELQANSPSSASVMCLGFVLTRLASIALTERKSTSTSTDISGLVASPKMRSEGLFFDGFEPAMPEGPITYSSDLFDLLVSLHSTNLPPLSAIHAKAVEMMALIMTRERMERLYDGDEDGELRLNERNLPVG
ncbi:hypothetical protein MRX96_021451, partial [Rhipicephalus microplus]